MKEPRIAIVMSEFNQPVTERLLKGALDALKERGIVQEENDVALVPGAVEIPLVAKWLATSQKFDAIIALGAVIRGETGHYDYVCEQVSQGCQKIMLDYDIPVVFGILTTDNQTQAMARCGGDKGDKGREAVEVALRMVELRGRLK